MILDQLAAELDDLHGGADELRTLEVWTDLFRVQRRIWHVWEWVTPWPVPLLPGVGAVVACFVQLQFGLQGLYTRLLPFPLNVAMLIGVAAAVYMLLDRPTVEGRPLTTWLRSQFRFYLKEPPHLDGWGRKLDMPTRRQVRLAAWSLRNV